VPVLLEVTDTEVGVVTLSSPERLNALTGPEFGELGEVLRSPEAKGLRGLVVRGEGRGFSAGADRNYLAELRAMDFDRRVAALRVGFDSTRELIRFPVPTVAVVHGACFGMASCIALACDRVVTTSSARWGFVFTAIGLPASDIVCHWLLSRRIGTRRAWSLLSEAATISGQQAAALGIADTSVTELPAIGELAWPAGDQTALSATKTHILELEGAFAALDQQIERILPVVATAVAGSVLGERLAAGR
jgi:2-(1,2-epoxy-1,2-dihydrophenyl)acetyl-CoA isomerase